MCFLLFTLHTHIHTLSHTHIHMYIWHILHTLIFADTILNSIADLNVVVNYLHSFMSNYFPMGMVTFRRTMNLPTVMARSQIDLRNINQRLEYFHCQLTPLTLLSISGTKLKRTSKFRNTSSIQFKAAIVSAWANILRQQ